MDIGVTYGRQGAFVLEQHPLTNDQQNKVYHISILLREYLALPMPFCEVRELPDWDRKIHIISDPDAQRLIESFHRYGPKEKSAQSLCPYADGSVKKRFASLVGEQNLGTTYEGESERYRKALQTFLNSSYRIVNFQKSWKSIANEWIDSVIQKGEANLFEETHRLVAECLIKGILGYDKCTAKDIEFNVSYWKSLFAPMPHQIKTHEELEKEGKPSLIQKGWNLFGDRKEFANVLWTYFVSSKELDSLAESILVGTSCNEDSLCYYLFKSQFTRQEVIDFIKGMLIAGQETTGYLLAFALYEYGKNTVMQDKHAQHPEEIRKAFLETLRLYSPGGALREAGVDMILHYNTPDLNTKTEFPQQHFIRKGDLVACVPNLAGHNLPHWNNPEVFDCERENLERVNEIPHFGSGPHRCVGEKVAKQEIHTLLEVILSKATLSIKVPLPELLDSFTLRPKHDLKIYVSKRVSTLN